MEIAGVIHSTGKLKKLLSRIAKFFRDLFIIEKNNVDKETDYVDEVAIIKPTTRSRKEKENEKKIQRIGGRLWKNSDYKRIRFMYKLVVNYIENYGIKISKFGHYRRDICKRLRKLKV